MRARLRLPYPNSAPKKRSYWKVWLVFLLLFAGAALVGGAPFQYRFCGHQGLIEHWAVERSLDPLWVAAVVKSESGFRADARSAVGALGLMQLMPETAEWLAELEGIASPGPDQLLEPELNIRLGTLYLAILLERYSGDRVAALAAYNAGPSTVARWRPNEMPMRVSQIGYPETRHYVQRVTDYHRRLTRFY